MYKMNLKLSFAFIAFICAAFVQGGVTSIGSSEAPTTVDTWESSGDMSLQPTTPTADVSTGSTRRRLKCPFYGTTRSHLSSRSHERKCCRKIVKDFKTRWFRGGSYLTTYFEKLKVWRCPELKEECDARTYVFNDYSKLLYLYFCNKTSLQNECKEDVFSTLETPENSTWGSVVEKMSSKNLTTDQMVKPCIQVALYGSQSGGYSYYHEIIDVFTPFCELTWCGFTSEAVERGEISSWTCMPYWCRRNVIVAIVTCALLAGAIVISNITVIFVFTTSPKLRNSQAVYKISLAIADLLVGVIVVPTFISTLLILFKSRTKMGDVIVTAGSNDEGTLPHKSGGSFSQRFSSTYVDFVGFFTVVSLIVSIYTLMMASFDRFMAIYQPLRYGRHNAKRMAIWASLLLWIIAMLFSVLPYVVPGLKYGLTASILVSSIGESALYLYAVAFVLPLLFVWLTTLATYFSTKRHARRRQMLSVRRTNSNNHHATSMETRLARTLASMVGIFTLCLLPVAVVIISSFFLGSIYHLQPSTFDTHSSMIYLSMEFSCALILMTNSLWNCFIYNARNEDFKKAARIMYEKIMRRLGITILWNHTRRLTSTVRSRRSTVMTTLGASTVRKLQKKASASTLRTMSNNEATKDGVLSEFPNKGGTLSYARSTEALSTNNNANGMSEYGTDNQAFDDKSVDGIDAIENGDSSSSDTKSQGDIAEAENTV